MVTRFAHPCHLVRLPPDLANHVTILIVDPDHVHFPEKTAVLLDFVRGGGGAAQFFGTFSRGAFLVNKGALYFKIANNLNLKLFFRL